MSKFLYLYTGGTMPETQEGIDAMMAAWQAYGEKLGKSLVDFGAPLGDRELLGGAQESAINGYSIVEASNLAAAKALSDGHPHLADGGAIEIAALGDM